MINVYNQIELPPKLPALTFLSRSQSTIANFPNYPSLEISQKSALPYQTGWMELANWGKKIFLRNCKPKILQKFWLIFFNQYLHRSFVTSAELFACVCLCLALRIGNCMPLYVKTFIIEWVVFKKRLVFSKNLLHVFYQCLNQHLFIGNRSLNGNSPGIYPRRENCLSDTAEIWKFSSFLLKNCSVFP